MSQQINLFSPALSGKKIFFSVRTMLQASVIVVGGLFCASIYLHFQIAKLQYDDRVLAEQLAAAQANLTQLMATSVARQKNDTLVREIESKELEEKNLQQVLGVFNRERLRNRQGYSLYLEAFARQIRDGIWLTELSIQGSDLHVQGRALKSDLVPAYLERLRLEPIMAGKSFSGLGIQTPVKQQTAASPAADGTSRFIEFDLRSSALTKADMSNAGVTE